MERQVIAMVERLLWLYRVKLEGLMQHWEANIEEYR
jgi:hypothetical protein